MLNTILAPVFVFAVIVIVHEGGHFIMAKLTGMKVEEFAVGFGPKIFSKKRGETVYSLRWIDVYKRQGLLGFRACTYQKNTIYETVHRLSRKYSGTGSQ